MAPANRRDIDVLIEKHETRLRDDFDDRDIAIYVRSLLVSMTGQWHFSAITPETHLYRDLRWNVESAERFRATLEAVFRVELAPWEFLCGRTVRDLTTLLGRALSRDRRRFGGAPPAA